jgi:chorismate mutase/prephenate dehydrogenase
VDSESSRRLAELREEIARLDRAITELLRRRFDLAAEVGRIKSELDAPVTVREVEDRVLARARAEAESCGVSPAVLESIFAAIVRGSVERQHRVGIARRERRGWRVLLVGGAGGMGAWFRRFFGLVGHAVEVVDPAFSGLPRTAGTFCELAQVPDLGAYRAILVAVPLDATARVLGHLATFPHTGVVVEIASIKHGLDEPLRAIEGGHSGLRAVALHPMFGPGKSPYQPLTFVHAVRGDEAAERAWLDQLLSHPYTELVSIPFAEHDRLMGWLLGLSHLSSMLYGVALTRSGADAAMLHRAASTTFRRQRETALSVLRENPDLYLDIQRLNPHRGEVFAALRDAAAHLEAAIEGSDREQFRASLIRARQLLEASGPFARPE